MASLLCTAFYSNSGPHKFKGWKQLKYCDFLVVFLVRLMYILKELKVLMCVIHIWTSGSEDEAGPAALDHKRKASSHLCY